MRYLSQGPVLSFHLRASESADPVNVPPVIPDVTLFFDIDANTAPTAQNHAFTYVVSPGGG